MGDRKIGRTTHGRTTVRRQDGDYWKNRYESAAAELRRREAEEKRENWQEFTSPSSDRNRLRDCEANRNRDYFKLEALRSCRETDDPAEAVACLNGAKDFAATLFYEFQSLDLQARAFQEIPVIKLAKGSMKLYQQKGEGWKGYARTTQMDDGRWVTVQTLNLRPASGLFGNANNYTVKFFDENGKALAYLDKGLKISAAEQQEGKGIFIESALKTVTGRKYLVTVEGDGNSNQKLPSSSSLSSSSSPPPALPAKPAPQKSPPQMDPKTAAKNDHEDWRPLVGQSVRQEIAKVCRKAKERKINACVDRVVTKMIESVKAVCYSGAPKDNVGVKACGAVLLNFPWADVAYLQELYGPWMQHIFETISNDILLQASNGTVHRSLKTFIEAEVSPKSFW